MMVHPIARLAAALAFAATFASPLHAETWNQAYGDSMNAGYFNVATAPATGTPQVIDHYGPFAPGAGFAFASNGYVFVGNEQGGVFGFNAAGTATPFSVMLEAGHSIAGAPVIGPHDDVYVVSVKGRGTNQPESALEKFSIGGAGAGRVLFPMRSGSRGEVMGAPTGFLTANGANLLIGAVVAYPNQASGGVETRLVIFLNGTLFLDKRIDVLVPETGEGADVSVTKFLEPRGGVAIVKRGTNPKPYFLVSDGFQSLSGFQFTDNGLVEDFHLRDDSRFHSIVGTPMMSTEGYYYVGTTQGLMMGQPGNQPPLNTKKEMKTNAPPTELRKPGAVAAAGGTPLDIYHGVTLAASFFHSGETHTSIAASYTHFYVSTTNSFRTYDGSHLPNGEFFWSNGGNNPPGIGPKGYVYAIADNKIFVFPPPKASPLDNVSINQPGTSSGGDAGVDSSGNANSTAANGAAVVMQPALPLAPLGQPTAQPTVQSQRFQPPMTTNGNRLFACEELDGDDCGKGDYKAISLAFCQAQGFAKVEDYDVDSRKVTAERLDGQFCSKNKCKVFDTIDCGM